MNPDDLQTRVDGIRWWHSIDLGHGIVTKGVDSAQAERLSRLQLPVDLAGKSVLDIGAWDGFFSFEAERRGAASVLATDHFCWSGDGWGVKAGFDYAHARLGSKAGSLDIDITDINPQSVGVHDVVLLLGV